MSGILYSKDSSGFSDLEMLKRKGPANFTAQSNDLGYFACSLLNIIDDSKDQFQKNKSGMLLYNNTTKYSWPTHSLGHCSVNLRLFLDNSYFLQPVLVFQKQSQSDWFSV